MNETFSCANISEKCFCKLHNKYWNGSPHECCSFGRYLTEEEETIVNLVTVKSIIEELSIWVNLMKTNQSGKTGFWSVKIWIKKMEERINELGGVEK